MKHTLLFYFAAAFAAGFIDAIVGGADSFKLLQD
jgi:uncharacterized membrane protein YfcA